jgi:hypothetical protein
LTLCQYLLAAFAVHLLLSLAILFDSLAAGRILSTSETAVAWAAAAWLALGLLLLGLSQRRVELQRTLGRSAVPLYQKGKHRASALENGYFRVGRDPLAIPKGAPR